MTIRRHKTYTGERTTFSEVFDAVPLIRAWEDMKRIPASRVDVGDVVVAECAVRQAMGSREVYFEMLRVAQLYLGPGRIVEGE